MSTIPAPGTDPHGTSPPDTVLAALHRRYGGADDVVVARLPAPPPPGPTEVRLRVDAVGLAAGDAALLAGRPRVVRLAFGLTRPRTTLLGRDVAGTVETVGHEVTDLAAGDLVYGEVTRGALAERIVVPAAQVVRRPTALSAAEASVVPVSGTTALQGLRDAGALQAGQHVLIHGASGGVGHLAVQLARAMGAEVTAVAGTANLDLVRGLGAHHVVDHHREDAFAPSRRYDLVLDLVGDRPLATVRRSLTARGTLVLAAGGTDRPWLGPLPRIVAATLQGPVVTQRLRPLMARATPADLDELRTRIDAGELRPVVARTFALPQAAEAYRSLLAGVLRPKLAVTVTPQGSGS